MQSKPIKNSDFDAGSAKHITFYNENFKRGRCDLLKKIQRSTRGGGTGTGDQSREIQLLKEQVNALEDQLTEMSGSFEDRLRRLEMDMLARMEQMMMAMQQQQQTQHAPLQLQSQSSVGTNASSTHSAASGQLLPLSAQQQLQHQTSISSQSMQLLTQQQPWEPDIFGFNGRNASIGVNSIASFQQPQNESKIEHQTSGGGAAGGATLPPHPKQKSLPVTTIFPPGGLNQRFNSLRGISTLSRGLSGLSRGQSIESTASGMVMKTSWDDKLFSMLMLGGENGGSQPEATMESNNMLAPAPMPARTASQVVSDSSMPTDEHNDMEQ